MEDPTQQFGALDVSQDGVKVLQVFIIKIMCITLNTFNCGNMCKTL